MANLFSSVGRGMTLIGIAWYAVSKNDMASPLGVIMLISTFLMLVLGPNVGIIIDRFPRKNILVLENIIGSFVFLVFAIMDILSGTSYILLTIMYISSMTLSQIHFPSQSALVQEIFSAHEYQKVNSTLEVQIQVTQMLAGALAGILLTNYDLNIVLFITAFTYLIAVIFSMQIQSTKKTGASREGGRKKEHNNWWVDLSTGFNYLMQHKLLFFFGVSSFMPFIMLMVSNYLAPVYIKIGLQENVSVFSTAEFTYAIGAFLAGMLMMYIASKITPVNFLIINTALFAIVMIGMIMTSNKWSFIAFYGYLGWTVATTRLLSQTIFMKTVPQELMGRVITSIDMIALVIRVIFIAIFTLSLDTIGARMGYVYLLILVLFSLLCFYQTRTIEQKN